MRRICVVLMTICLTLGCMAQQFEKDVFTTASGKKLTITCIKHASIMMEYDGKVIYFDPVTNLEPRTDFTTWPKANFIFVTHEHHDHFDSMALTELRRNYTVIYCNHNVYTQWGSGYVLANGDKAEVCENITVEAVPAYNTTAGREKFHPKGRGGPTYLCGWRYGGYPRDGRPERHRHCLPALQPAVHHDGGAAGEGGEDHPSEGAVPLSL